jgi:hypothetical protein
MDGSSIFFNAPGKCAAHAEAEDASCTFLVCSDLPNTLATEKSAFTESKRGCLICILVSEKRDGQCLGLFQDFIETTINTIAHRALVRAA